MSYDLSLAGVHALLSTHVGRDQFGNLVQYVTQGVAGVLADRIAALSKGSPERVKAEYYHFYFKTVSLAVGNARRTVRWFASLGVILALKKLYETNVCPWPTNPTAFALAQLALLFWHFTDNYRWLIMNKLVDGDSIRWKQISFSGFTVSALISSAYFFNELYVVEHKVEPDAKKVRENQRGLLKNLLTLVTTLHTSELYVTHDAICGLAGAGAAIIVLQDLFPKKPTTAAAKKD